MIEAISNVTAIIPSMPKPSVAPKLSAADVPPIEISQVSFQKLLNAGIDATNTKIAEADRLVAAFAVDNDIPAHQVTFALEEARLSLEMMIQVRNRLVEGYQQIMNMQV
jgi:flagellar hook-basal body complex protein FliE